MNAIKTPTLTEIKDAGYKVDIEHTRMVRIVGSRRGKIFVKDVLSSHIPSYEEEKIEIELTEVLPKGGLTEVYVTDPETSAEFYGFAKCHPNDNYDKRVGIRESINRIVGLMMVMDGKDGFRNRLQL